MMTTQVDTTSKTTKTAKKKRKEEKRERKEKLVKLYKIKKFTKNLSKKISRVGKREVLKIEQATSAKIISTKMFFSELDKN